MSELEYTEQGFRMTTDTKRHHRTTNWDYSGVGIYHITLVVAERYPLFGELFGDSPESAYVKLNAFGKEVLEILRSVPQYRRQRGYQLKILASQIMPDHIHVAIQVLEPLPKSIGAVIRGFKSACTSLYKNNYAATGGNHAAKGENADRDIIPFSRMFARIGSIWQPDIARYHERIIHGHNQIDSLIHYIKDNPRRLWLKRANPDLFRIHQQTPIAGVTCTTLGNMFLYEYPQRAALHCSRTLTQAEIDTLREECLSQAANGTVYVSPAISVGEKQVSRALREAGFPIIILLNDGFPATESPHYQYYKPKGVYFEACAEGNLLLVEPNPELFELPDIETQVYAKTGSIPHNSKRYRFVALNALAEKIASHPHISTPNGRG